jgi:REP element-mobilizing transposase RayT
VVSIITAPCLPKSYSVEMYLDRKYCYRRTLPHLLKDNRPVFVTFATFKRWRLPAETRQLVLECCLREHTVTIDLHAVVVMPTHAHLLFTALRNEEGWLVSLPQIMRLIKGRSANFVNKLLDRQGRVWQEESFDHVLRSNESLSEKMDYLCQNPVRAGLVRSTAEYPWLWRGDVPVL